MIDELQPAAASERRPDPVPVHPHGLHGAAHAGSSAQPVSTINRDGRDGLGGGTGAGDGFYGSGVDRPYIWKTFGFKQWDLGRHTLNLGGLLTDPGRRRVGSWRAGRRADSADNPIGYVSTSRSRRTANGVSTAFYDLNLTLAWGFPIAGDRVKGNLRIEGTNVTNEQDQINTNLYGEPLRVRREFQRPSTYRAMFGVSF